MTKQDFIDLELRPFAGDYAEDFDLDEVFDDLYHDGIVVLCDADFRWADGDHDVSAYFERNDHSGR